MQAGLNPLLTHLSDFIFLYGLDRHAKICVAVSGGADSLALAHLLMSWRKNRTQGPDIVVLHVNHGLRDGALAEQEHLHKIVESWPNTEFVALFWEGEKPQAALQESARAARYNLMQDWMKEYGAQALFVAHHSDDQAETFLIRLIAGSGLDGLAAIQEVNRINENLSIFRPFLRFSHAECEAYCREQNLKWIEDPSNENDDFMRPRLRKLRHILETEGLTNKRLAATAQRLSRARGALDLWRDSFIESHVKHNADAVTLNYKAWIDLPEDIKIRVLSWAAQRLNSDANYPPSLEKLEDLVADLKADAAFPRQSFYKILWSRSLSENTILLEKENAD